MERASCLAVLLSCLVLLAGWNQPADAAETIRVSVSTTGEEADDDDLNGVISANGRFVAFESQSTNLVPGLDGNNHVLVHDLATSTTIVIDSGPSGLSDAASHEPSISSDGRFVAFHSRGTNLVDLGPFVGPSQIFVRDIHTGEVILASMNNAGQPNDADASEAAISASGRFIAFTTPGNLTGDDFFGIDDVYVYDRDTGETELVSVASPGVGGDLESGRASISADGRYVAFTSNATDLVVNDTNDAEDVFLRDRVAGTTTRISTGPGGVERNGISFIRSGPVISGDGAFVVLESDSDNFIANDTNMAADIFVHDTASGTKTRVSVTSSGQQTDDFRASQRPSISDNGRFVVFDSSSNNLDEAAMEIATSVFLHDRDTGTTVLIPSDVVGSQWPTVSNDGERVAFDSVSANLVPDDTNGRADAFVHDRQTLPPSAVSVVASVLPTSRSVQVGDTASAFATIINTGTADGLDCAPGLPIGMAIPFSFQPTDAATNAPIGTVDVPVDIAAGQAQSFVFSLAPTVALEPTDIAMEFSCSNSDPATTIVGVNTFLFSASDQPVGDVIVLAATLGEIPGVVDLDGVSGAGAFAIATFNVGASDTFTVAPRPSDGLAVTLSICETNPGDGTCLQPPSAEVVTAIANGETPTFAVFASGTGVEIPLDAANNRISVDFTDSGDANRGGSSVAIRTY